MSNSTILNRLGLRGLIHLRGNAGSGKTLFAVALASDISKYSRVEWINADGKKSFLNQLKKNVLAHNGHPENVIVTLTKGYKELVDEIHSLVDRISGTNLIVIDPITRVLDMARNNPTLWGREIVEDILPTLVGIIEQFNVHIVISSECRLMDDSVNQAVHYSTITKWVDHDLHITRDPTGAFSHVLTTINDHEKETALLRLNDEGILDVIPKLLSSELSEGVSCDVW